MGQHAKSRIARWVRAARYMPEEVQDFLQGGHAPAATDKFIFDNEFLCLG